MQTEYLHVYQVPAIAFLVHPFGLTRGYIGEKLNLQKIRLEYKSIFLVKRFQQTTAEIWIKSWDLANKLNIFGAEIRRLAVKLGW